MLIIVAILIVCIFISVMSAQVANENEIEGIYSEQGYERLRNLLEDCTLVSSDFQRMNFVIENNNSTGFFRFTIRFYNFWTFFIFSQKVGLEWAERQIQSDFHLELESKKGTGDLNAIIQNATNKSYQSRRAIQKDADENFYKILFGGHLHGSRNFVIDSPFECYASSGGKYIVDTDYWKKEGDDAVYTGLLEFEQEGKDIVPYAIEKIAKKYFPNAKIIRYSNGCNIFL